jgi:hypothetical protein
MNYYKYVLKNTKKEVYLIFFYRIQNEFLDIIVNRIRDEIILKIKGTKYYSLILDCTSDIAHEEQMTQAVRYFVQNNDNECEIEESFLKLMCV